MGAGVVNDVYNHRYYRLRAQDWKQLTCASLRRFISVVTCAVEICESWWVRAANLLERARTG